MKIEDLPRTLGSLDDAGYLTAPLQYEFNTNSAGDGHRFVLVGEEIKSGDEAYKRSAGWYEFVFKGGDQVLDSWPPVRRKLRFVCGHAYTAGAKDCHVCGVMRYKHVTELQ